MYGLRYEEHIRLSGELPFSLAADIEITSTSYSHEANWHENTEIQYCRNGNGTVSLDGTTEPFYAGDIVVVNTNVIHHILSNDKVNYTCIIIDRIFCEDAGIDTASLQFEHHFKSSIIENYIKELITIYEGDDICRTAKLKDLILRILIELRENHTVKENVSVKKDVFSRVKHTIKYIRENYGRKMSLDELAKNVITDKYTLSREFKRTTNQTIIEYINSYRCKKAAELLTEGATAADAARKCGFENLSFFSKTFKKYMGLLPSKIKK